MGFAAAGALVYDVGLLSLVSAVFIVIVVYPAAVLIGRVPFARFAAAAAPAQAVAFTSRWSLAALPATIEGAREGLGLPEEVVSFFMAPVLYAANVPVEGLGVLLGVDTVPDMFRTMANVTGWLGGGSILARWVSTEPSGRRAAPAHD